ncbi:MAG TPA: trehalose-phosphatase [Terriglobales bacterium]|nr:trehalose-phosphatase [Terriglobales bacterium]
MRDTTPQSLFDHWATVRRRLRAARHLAVFLDFDGSLVPLRARPEEVWLDDSGQRLLQRLARHPRVTLVLISGRRRADLRRRVNVPGARYLGLHGWEHGDGASARPGTRRLMRLARRMLAERLRGLPGIWIEDKGPVFVVHYRGASVSTARRARPIVRETLEWLQPDLRVLAGRKVWEVLPRELGGKGVAVCRLLEELPRPTLSIFIGDDVSDERAFAALRGELTVRVGRPRRTRAHFRLRNPIEVRSFLEKLEMEMTARIPVGRGNSRRQEHQNKKRAPDSVERRNEPRLRGA